MYVTVPRSILVVFVSERDTTVRMYVRHRLCFFLMDTIGTVPVLVLYYGTVESIFYSTSILY